jgi:hypothetical protein
VRAGSGERLREIAVAMVKAGLEVELASDMGAFHGSRRGRDSHCLGKAFGWPISLIPTCAVSPGMPRIPSAACTGAA